MTVFCLVLILLVAITDRINDLWIYLYKIITNYIYFRILINHAVDHRLLAKTLSIKEQTEDEEGLEDEVVEEVLGGETMVSEEIS